MTAWVMTYQLACGCKATHVHTQDKHKLEPGDLWTCERHGDVEITGTVGRGA